MNGYRNFGISSYSFHGIVNAGMMNLCGFFESARYRYNVDFVDIWNYHLASYEPEYLALIRQNLDERGLTLGNLCCDLAAVWDDDPAQRQDNEHRALKCIAAAQVLGARSIRFDLGIRDAVAPDDKLEYTAKKFSQYCKLADAFGAKMGPENHWGASTDLGSVCRLFEAVPDKNFGLLLHLGNWQTAKTAEEKDDCDRRMIPCAMHTHLDFEHCLDADRVFPPLSQAGYAGVWTVESHKSVNEYANVAAQLAQLRRVLAPMAYQGKPDWEKLVEQNKAK